MRRINWVLPFATMHYLNSLAEELSNNPYIIMITGIEDCQGNIENCSIAIKDSEDIDDIILLIGATIGAHSVAYGMEVIEARKESAKHLRGLCLGLVEAILEEEEKEEQEVILLPEIAGQTIEESEDLFEKAEETEIEEAVIIEEEEVTTEEIEEVIEKTPDSPAKALLRKILTNFKKGAAIFAAFLMS